MRLTTLAIACLSAFAATAAAQDQTIYKPGQGVTAPALVQDVKPRYTRAAMDAGIQGVVELDCVVLPDGSVGDVRVTRSLHLELDAQAVAAVKQWVFRPGTKDGEPVAVEVTVELSFAIRGNRDLPPQPSDPAPPAEPVVYKVGHGVTAPSIISQVQPRYTGRPRRERIQGVVVMKSVILPDGTVGGVRVVKSLDPELDEAAVSALRQWTFKPSLKDGVPIHVQVDVEMTFTLR